MKKLSIALALLLSPGFSATISPMIIGGTGVPSDAYPWNVRFENSVVSVCSGVLIAPQVILTSAHCVKGATFSSYKIRIGGVDFNSGEYVTVAKDVAIASNYNPNPPTGQPRNDYAVILLRNPSSMKPVKMSKIPAKANQPGKVIGWGITTNSASASGSSSLQQADVTTIDMNACTQFYLAQNQTSLPDIKDFCTVSSNAVNQGACVGDSGGPFVVKEAAGWVLYGIIQGGIDYCAQPNQPTIIENVAYETDLLTIPSQYNVKNYVEYMSSQLNLLQ